MVGVNPGTTHADVGGRTEQKADDVVERRTRISGAARLGVALTLLAGLVVGVAPSTGADQVHLELSSYEAMELPMSWYGLPRAVASDGSMVADSSPPGDAMFWTADGSAGGITRPEGYPSSRLNDIGDDHLAVGAAISDVGRVVPFTFDLDTRTWTPLSMPDPGSSGEAIGVLPDGRIVGNIGVFASLRIAVWPDATSAPVLSSQQLEIDHVTRDGQIVVTQPTDGSQATWDPATDTTTPLLHTTSGAVIDVVGDRYLVSTSLGTVDLWDRSSGALATFSGPEAYLNASGHVLGWSGDGWVLYDPDTGISTPVRPFGMDPARGRLIVLTDDDRVIARVDDGVTTSLVAWSAESHPVVITASPSGDDQTYFDPWMASPGGIVVGNYQKDGKAGFWRASFRLAPDAPENLAGDAAGAAVALDWEPPRSAGDAPIESYRILADGVVVAEVDAATTTWSGSGDGTRTYTVVAVNDYGESTPSNAVVLDASTTPVAATAAEVAPAFTG